MIKNSIGELKLSPIKEDGKFVFFNDFITINGKVSKGDKITIYVNSYDLRNGSYHLDATVPQSADVVVRGIRHRHETLANFATVTDLYNHVSELYRESFYFGSKVN